MKTEKNMFTGMGHVYRFTLRQLLVSKANIVSMVILMLIVLLALPVTTLLSGGSIQAETPLQEITVYLQNDTSYELTGADVAAADERFDGLKLAEAGFSAEEAEEELALDELLVYIYKDTQWGMFSIDIIYQQNSPLREDSGVEELGNALTEAFRQVQYQKLDATQEQLVIASSFMEADADSMEAFLSQGEISWEVQYGVQMFYSIAVMMVVILSISYIIRSVTEEKVSKLVEMLLVTIQPMALLAGKILAVMTYIVLQIAVYAGCFVISYQVCQAVLDMSAMTAIIQQAGISMEMFQMGPKLAVIILVSMLLGYLMYAILAGLLGACCSTTEDIQSAMGLPTMLCMISYFVAIMTAAIDSSSSAMAVSLIPFVSTFCAPVQYFLGNISMGTMALSWLIQAVVVGGLMLFSAKIYRDLIVYKGERIKLSAMLKMAGVSSKGGTL